MITQTVRFKAGTASTFSLYFQNVFGSTNLFSRERVFRITALPAFVDFEYLDGSGHVDYWELFIDDLAFIGTYEMYFTYGGSPPENDCKLIIEVVAELTEEIEVCNNSEAINLVWINREGGRSSYIFDQRKNFGILVDKNQTFDNNGIIKNVYNGKIFEQKTVFKTGLSKNEIDFLDSLRYSIQAWEYNETTDISTPIVIDTSNFDKYNTKQNLYEINIKYRIAEYKEIQNQ